MVIFFLITIDSNSAIAKSGRIIQVGNSGTAGVEVGAGDSVGLVDVEAVGVVVVVTVEVGVGEVFAFEVLITETVSLSRFVT